MKKKELSNLARRFLSYAPNFRAHGTMLVAEPIGHVIRAIDFEGSSFDSEFFYINVFFQPLCVPSDVINYTLGFRLRDSDGVSGWKSTSTNFIENIGMSLQMNAFPFLLRVGTLQGAAEAAESMQSRNLNVLEAIAYCRALDGRLAEAVVCLKDILNSYDVQVPWEVRIASRSNELLQSLHVNPSKGQQLLLQWEAQTAQALGIGSLWASEIRPEGI